ncbi:hypothetical protein NP233_g2100 [Leucocoprinus birnbaumii]|uniref:Uncharacterized protein n=1 Tax=Leucocoprinus birnbaumii TaxID=56174 RepID=A0AAD5W1Y2_9AGAR|nr:hypothetical protein NP233_g2100 [Leucocoprinus birnbaumii]
MPPSFFSGFNLRSKRVKGPKPANIAPFFRFSGRARTSNTTLARSSATIVTQSNEQGPSQSISQFGAIPRRQKVSAADETGPCDDTDRLISEEGDGIRTDAHAVSQTIAQGSLKSCLKDTRDIMLDQPNIQETRGAQTAHDTDWYENTNQPQASGLVESVVQNDEDETTCDVPKYDHVVYNILLDGLRRERPDHASDESNASQASLWPQELELERLAILALLDHEASSIDPSHKLDVFHRYIMEQVPETLPPVTKLVILFYVILITKALQSIIAMVCDIANFLNLTVETVLGALQDLRSLVDFPTEEAELLKREGGFLDQSFTDFLQDPQRSGKLALDMAHA